MLWDGNVSNSSKGLKFRQDVKPRSSYEHIASKSIWFFSTGGRGRGVVCDLFGWQVEGLSETKVIQPIMVIPIRKARSAVSVIFAYEAREPHTPDIALLKASLGNLFRSYPLLLLLLYHFLADLYGQLPVGRVRRENFLASPPSPFPHPPFSLALSTLATDLSFEHRLRRLRSQNLRLFSSLEKIPEWREVPKSSTSAIRSSQSSRFLVRTKKSVVSGSGNE